MTSTNEIRERCRELSDKWFVAQCRNPFAAYHLFYRPSGKQSGELTVVMDENTPPEGFILADAKRLSPGWTVEDVRKWMIDVAWKLPVLE